MKWNDQTESWLLRYLWWQSKLFWNFWWEYQLTMTFLSKTCLHWPWQDMREGKLFIYSHKLIYVFMNENITGETIFSLYILQNMNVQGNDLQFNTLIPVSHFHLWDNSLQNVTHCHCYETTVLTFYPLNTWLFKCEKHIFIARVTVLFELWLSVPCQCVSYMCEHT